MHFYLLSMVVVIGWMIVLTLCGRGLARLLPPRAQLLARCYFSPALGLGLFVLVATGSGWLFGDRPVLVTVVTVVLLIGAVRGEKNWPELVRQLAWILCASIVIAAGPLMTVWRYSGYNVYNDTFTYLAHGQWLQEHAFRETIAPTVLQPVYTQIAFFQKFGLRMGGSFFLAWVQAGSPFHWSLYAYPAVVSIVLAAGAQAISGLAAALFPTRSRRLVLLWSLVVGTSLSGFTFGAYAGFLAQLVALTLGTTFIGLLAAFRPSAGAGPSQRWLQSLPLATTFAALVFAYSELLPFMSLTLTAWFVVRLVLDKRRQDLLTAGGTFIVWCLVLLNFECARAMRALLIQVGAVVGWAVPWSTGDFAGHALGLRSGTGDFDWQLFGPNTSATIALVILQLLAVLIIWLCWSRRTRLARWSAPLAFFTICGGCFIIFRYLTPSPWPVGIGQTWNQYKLSNWSSPVVLAVFGAGLFWLGRVRWVGVVLALMMIAWTGVNVRAHYQLAPSRIAAILDHTGLARNPFAAYEAVRTAALAAQPRGEIFVDLGGESKSRQIVAYFLHDFPVAADWSGDNYIYPHLPEGWRQLSLLESSWWVHRRNEDPGIPNLAPGSGAIAFSPVPEYLAIQHEISGGYPVESDASGWWVWTPDQIAMTLKIYGRLPARVRLRFSCVVAAKLHELTILARTQSGVVLNQVVTVNDGWQNYESPAFELPEGNVEINLSSKATPVPIGPGDPRTAAFLAKNVRLEFISARP